MGETTRMTEKGQTMIPKAMREKYGLDPGDEVRWEDTEEGTRREAPGVRDPDAGTRPLRLWFLLQQGVEVVPELFEEKMAVVDAPPVVTVTVSEQEWDRDLSILVEHPPSYRTVRATVEDTLSAVGIDVVDETG